MEHDRIERLAEEAYVRAGLPADSSRSPLELAEVLLGRGSRQAVFDVANLDTPAQIWAGNAGDSLLIREGLGERAAEWHGARALAGWMLRHESATVADLDLLAACLRSPRAAVRTAFSYSGPAFDDLADALQISTTSAALRVGETIGIRMIVYSPTSPPRIRGRGKAPLKWCRVRLSDEPGRYALVAG